ncbi:hypothetical protein HN419_01845 [Candidatus Woesearchaeota archaeon]|nr:hypothetical protein [Candidatus Woesearchaeota archaeon]MBT3537261.1 hypothetical protein [Candidatus Woesearchaeota archaeon]MBT4698400.1 hypothetical protein [Candidatus Woesearchaeota archaeon]MBT7106429.1 hypothetical protein [Candidatus Woesearchaeota archaeon]MBT7931196.1 hypothetical protein [Candidatus Woesearchaeota archaeon]
MSSKKYTISLTLVIICLVAISAISAFAFEENLLVTTTSDKISGCSCGLTTNVVTILNTGSITSSYLVTLSGSGKKFATLSEDVFILKPGERKDVLEYIKIGCDTVGEFDLTTTVETVLGNEHETSQSLSINNCPNVQILAKDSEQQTCPGSTPRFEFEIQNTGSFDEEYEIKMSPFSEYITLSENLVPVKAGQSKSIYAFINMDNSFSGEIEFLFSAYAKNSEIMGEVPVKLKVNPCFDYAVGFDNKYTVCRNIGYEFPLKIKNDADVANVYSTKVESKEDWITPKDGSFLVYSEDVTETQVLINPKNTEPGQYEFTLKVSSERGQIEHYAESTVNVQDCYKIQVKTNLPELVSGELNTGYITLTNAGTRNDTFYLYQEGAEWIEFASEEIYIPAGEARDVEVKLNIPLDVPKKLDVRFLAISYNYNFSNDYEDSTLKIIPQEEAYELDILAEDVRVSYEATIVPIRMKHSGLIDASYTFSVDGPAWVSINETNLFLESEIDSELNLILTPTNLTEQGSYPITIYAAVDRVSDLTYARNLDVVVSEKGLFMRVLPFILIGLGILVLLFVIISIVKRAKNRPRTLSAPIRSRRKPLDLIEIYNPTTTSYKRTSGKKIFKWIIAILLLLVLLFAIGFGGYKTYNHFTSNSTDNETIQQSMPLTTGAVVDTQEEVTSEDPIFSVDTTYLASLGRTIYLDRNVVTDIPITFNNPSTETTKYTLKLITENATSWTSIDITSADVLANSSLTAYLTTTPDDFVISGQYPITLETNYILNGESITEAIDLNLDVGHYTLFYIIKILIYALIGLVALAILILIITLLRRGRSPRTPKIRTEKAPGDSFWVRWKENRKAAKERRRLRRIKSKEFYAEHNIKSTNIGEIEPIFVKRYRRPKKGLKSFFKWLAAIVIILLVLGLAFYAGNSIYKNATNSTNSTGITGWNIFSPSADNETTTEDPIVEDVPEEPVSTLEQPLFYINRSELDGSGNIIEVEKFSVVDIPVTVTNPNNESIQYKINVNKETGWIEVSETELDMKALESKQINITIYPDENIEIGDYALSIETQVTGANEVFKEKLELRITEDEFRYLWQVIAGVLLLIILALLIDFVRFLFRRNSRKKYFEEIKDEKPKKEKKPSKTTKTNLKLTSRKKK